MRGKIRHVDLHADEFLAAVAGELTPTELGVYWMINLLIYSRGEAIEYDLDWIRAKFKPSKGNRWIAPILKRLIKSGRLTLDGNLLGSRRALDELLLSHRRIVDASLYGGRGGRPRKHINGLDKASPLNDEKLTNNQQPTASSLQSEAADTPVSAMRARPTEFAQWWDTYPHKIGKGDAEKKFAIARKLATFDQLCDGVRRYMASKPADYRWVNPAVWLHQKRWEDQPAYVQAAEREAATPGHDRVAEFWEGFEDQARVKRDNDWAKRLYDWARQPRGFWAQQWGPRPNHQDCQAPKHMLDWAVRRARIGDAEGEAA